MIFFNQIFYKTHSNFPLFYLRNPFASSKNSNSFHKNLPSKLIHNDDEYSLSIGLPGYNIPWSHSILVFLALILASLIHEFGHALAAALEKISINGAGAFITFIFPGAFVNLNNIELSNCDLIPRMRILCAGVWHNLVLCVFTVSTVKYLLPIIFKIAYFRGICVVDMPKVLRGGIIPGDEILSINNCYSNDHTLEEFQSCLIKEDLNNYGVCIHNTNLTAGYYTANLEFINSELKHKISSLDESINNLNNNIKSLKKQLSSASQHKNSNPSHYHSIKNNLDTHVNNLNNINLNVEKYEQEIENNSNYLNTHQSKHNLINVGSYSSCSNCNIDSHTLCYAHHNYETSRQIHINNLNQIRLEHDIDVTHLINNLHGSKSNTLSKSLASSTAEDKFTNNHQTNDKNNNSNLKVCLNVRQALKNNRCNDNSPCTENFTCMKLLHQDNQKLISILIANGKSHDDPDHNSNSKSSTSSDSSSDTDITPILYFGSMKEFLNEMVLTNYCSRVPLLLPVFLPDILRLENFSNYE